MIHRRVLVTGKGGREVLRVEDQPTPTPGQGQARVRVHAAGMNFADVLARRGQYPGLPKHPFVSGYDYAGVVEAVGPGALRLKVGNRVAGLMPHFGAHADEVLVEERHAALMLEGLSMEQAAATPVTFLTAWALLHQSAKVQPGSQVLVLSAAGGVGTALLQLGRIAEVRCLASASKEKHALLRELGGVPIDRKAPLLPQLQALAPEGVDAVFDPLGGSGFAERYQALKRGGRLLSYGFLAVPEGGGLWSLMTSLARPFFYNLLPGKHAEFWGDLVSRVKREPDVYRRALETLFGQIVSGQLTPVIGARLRFDDIAQAHELLERGQTTGKVLLVTEAGASTSG
jgi:NADPH:quinone reductase-like Zn-dependent oxidoreductase